MKWVYDDGGRSGSKFTGEAGDCGVRAIAIATNQGYEDVYYELWDVMARVATKREKTTSPRNGVTRKAMRAYMEEYGSVWVPTMGIGTGCTV